MLKYCPIEKDNKKLSKNSCKFLKLSEISNVSVKKGSIIFPRKKIDIILVRKTLLYSFYNSPFSLFSPFPLSLVATIEMLLSGGKAVSLVAATEEEARKFLSSIVAVIQIPNKNKDDSEEDDTVIKFNFVLSVSHFFVVCTDGNHG